MIARKKQELAWAAGVFDGEGTAATTVDRRGRGYLRVNLSVYQAGGIEEPPQLLQRFKEAVGVGYINGPQTRPTGFRRKPMWAFSVQNIKDFKIVAAKLRPWLSDVKIVQLDAVLERMETYKKCRTF